MTEAPRPDQSSIADRWKSAIGKAVTAVASPVLIGADHLPETGAFVVLSNHPTKGDRQLLPAAVGRPCHVVDLAHPDGVDQAVRYVSQGQIVVSFVEGHRSIDGAMHRALPEVADLVARVFAPIIPAAICPPVESRGWLAPVASTIDVRFGRPLELSRFRDTPMDDAARQTAVDAVTHAIVALSGRPYIDADAAERAREVKSRAARERNERIEASRQARRDAEAARLQAQQQAEADERRAEQDRQWAERAAREQAARAAQADSVQRSSIRSQHGNGSS